MDESNRISKYAMIDLATYEPLSSEVIYDLVFGDEADHYRFQENVVNPKYIRIDITTDRVRFYVFGEIVKTIYFDGGIVTIKKHNSVLKERYDQICLDAVVKREIYKLLKEYNVKNIDSCSITLSGIEVYSFLFCSSKLRKSMYDRDGIYITSIGEDTISLIKMISFAYYDYVKNGNLLSDDRRKELMENGILDAFENFITQSS